MAITQMEPPQAKAAMDETEGSVYLDVRTEMEFAQGHATGAINIPVVFPAAGGMMPNPDFPSVIQNILPDKDQTIFCGCQVGGRSQMAAEMLSQLGYTNLVNIQGGFGGLVQNGVLVVTGWRDSGLPVETDVNEANSYESFKQKAEG